MHLDPYLAQVHDQLAAAAALGDERTKEVAAGLASAADAAVQLAIVGAVSAAADEITAALLDQPGSPTVTLRIDGREIEAAVSAQAPTEAVEERREDGDTNARISLRLSEVLKSEIEAAAGREGVSVNTWLQRAASSALAPRAARPGPRAHTSGSRVTGWITG